MARWLLPTLALALLGCRREAASGARIAEDPDGPWVHVCAVRVVGPDVPDATFRGVARHATEAEAKRRSVANACGTARGGAPCTGLTGGWTKAKEWCKRMDPPDGAEKKAVETQCEVTMVKPGGRSKATEQKDGPTIEGACRDALVAACAGLDGGDACLEPSGGWTQERSVARRRPDEY